MQPHVASTCCALCEPSSAHAVFAMWCWFGRQHICVRPAKPLSPDAGARDSAAGRRGVLGGLSSRMSFNDMSDFSLEASDEGDSPRSYTGGHKGRHHVSTPTQHVHLLSCVSVAADRDCRWRTAVLPLLASHHACSKCWPVCSMLWRDCCSM